jgi:hypothetical protein
MNKKLGLKIFDLAEQNNNYNGFEIDVLFYFFILLIYHSRNIKMILLTFFSVLKKTLITIKF